MKVFLLGLDGATWDMVGPMLDQGLLPNLAKLRKQGSWGTLHSVFPPLSPVAWTGVMTGKNSGKHGIFEFLEHQHDPLNGYVNSSRAIDSKLLWEIAQQYGKKTVVGGVPMSYPPRPAEQFPGFFLGDFLSPAQASDFSSDPTLFSELEKAVGRYQPWSTSIHDGGNESVVLEDLCQFMEQHLKAIMFMMNRCDWDLFMFDLMATDRLQHELWHVWDLNHPAAHGREHELKALRPRLLQFWQQLDTGIGEIEAQLPSDTTFLIISDHGFGPIEQYVNFNVWLLEKGYITLKDSFYVKQKRLVLPEGCYSRMDLWDYEQARPG